MVILPPLWARLSAIRSLCGAGEAIEGTVAMLTGMPIGDVCISCRAEPLKSNNSETCIATVVLHVFEKLAFHFGPDRLVIVL